MELDPACFEASRQLASLLLSRGDFDQAEYFSRRALSIRPAAAAAHNNLGNALKHLGRREEAAAAYRDALKADPQLAEAHFGLAICLHESEQFEQAKAHYSSALRFRPDLADPWHNLGILLEQQDDVDGALEHYLRAISLRPDSAAIHLNYAMQLLARGDFEAGWEEYEWRWRLPESRASEAFIDRPRWDGSMPRGRTILLFAEQGFGDAIQFSRYAREVSERGARVLLKCPPKLKSLFQSSFAGIAVIADGERVPAFDCACPLMSLPRLFGTRVETIPAATPYLQADARRTEYWKRKIADRDAALKIGLFWATDNPAKSMEFEHLAPLARIPGVCYYSLQKGAAAKRAAQLPAGIDLMDYGGELRDFSDDAALIMNLDLVISVDTATAHLAGALGRPVWTLTHFPADWRWLRGRQASPWYPTMRLFRQARLHDWSNLMQVVAGELRRLVSPGGHGS